MSNRCAPERPRSYEGRSRCGEVVFQILGGRSNPLSIGSRFAAARGPGRFLDQLRFPTGTVVEVPQARVGNTRDVLIGFLPGYDEEICLPLQDLANRVAAGGRRLESPGSRLFSLILVVWSPIHRLLRE